MKAAFLGVVTLGILGAACGDSASQNDGAPAVEPHAAGGAGSPADTSTPRDADAGDANAADAATDSRVVWSADVALPHVGPVRLAATDSHVAVVSGGPLTMMTDTGQAKTEVPLGPRQATFVRAVGTKLMAAGIEGTSLVTSPGAFTAEVTTGGLIDIGVVPIAQELLSAVVMMDSDRHIGLVQPINGAQKLTAIRRFTPGGAMVQNQWLTEDSASTSFTIRASAMADKNAIAGAGSLGLKATAAIRYAPPIEYTMPAAAVSALAFGPNRLVVASRQENRSTVHVSNMAGQLVESATVEGIRVEAILVPTEREVIVAGEADDAVNGTRAVVRRFDFAKNAEVWRYEEPVASNGVTRAVALAVAPSGAVYVAMDRSASGSTTGKVVRLAP